MPATPDEVAADLHTLFSKKFGDSTKAGAYRLARTGLRDLAKRKSLKKSIVEEIMLALHETHGLLLVPVDGTIKTALNFGVMKTPTWREIDDKGAVKLARAG